MSRISLALATLGTPRIGPRRELKNALESYGSDKSDEKALLETAAALRAANWARQKSLGVTAAPPTTETRSSAVPRPEDIFLCWLLDLPDGADLRAAAAVEIARLDRRQPLAAGPKRLRELFLAASEWAGGKTRTM